MDNGAPRLVRLERLINQLWRALNDLAKRLSAQEQQMWQAFSYLGSGSGGGAAPLVRVWIGSAIAAGTFGTPTSGSATVCVRSSNGWTTSGGTSVTVYNTDTTAVGAGGKAGWAQYRDDGTYELVVWDC